MILVDTSVWIDFLNHARSSHATALKHLIEKNEELCLADIHITEILQGINNEKAFAEIRDYLLLFPILQPRGIDTYIKAAHISQNCRKKGNPVLKTVDTIIAAIAIESNVPLLHKDKDFDTIALHNPLKIFSVNH